MSKKTVIIIASSFIGVLVLLLLVLWIMTLINKKQYTYEEVENKMYDATVKYYKENPQDLPSNEGKSILSYNTLVEKEYIEPLKDLLKDGESCSAEVDVYKDELNYTYIPKLSCSDKYTTIELAEHIKKTTEVVTSGSGLYSDGNGGYYYKGKISNNYITVGSFINSSKKRIGILWQIISIENDNRIKVRALYPANRSLFDNRYNVTRKSNSGYNDFEMSLLKENLIKIENGENFLTNDQKSVFVKSNLCLGGRNGKDTSKDGSTECSKLSNDKYLFGLMNPYEYMRASLDENCNNMFSLACQNFNFLSGDGFGYVWTTTPNTDNDYQVYSFDGYSFYSSSTDRERKLYLTAYISPYVTFKGGEGTETNPYRILKEVKTK